MPKDGQKSMEGRVFRMFETITVQHGIYFDVIKAGERARMASEFRKENSHLPEALLCSPFEVDHIGYWTEANGIKEDVLVYVRIVNLYRIPAMHVREYKMALMSQASRFRSIRNAC